MAYDIELIVVSDKFSQIGRGLSSDDITDDDYGAVLQCIEYFSRRPVDLRTILRLLCARGRFNETNDSKMTLAVVDIVSKAIGIDAIKKAMVAFCKRDGHDDYGSAINGVDDIHSLVNLIRGWGYMDSALFDAIIWYLHHK